MSLWTFAFSFHGVWLVCATLLHRARRRALENPSQPSAFALNSQRGLILALILPMYLFPHILYWAGHIWPETMAAYTGRTPAECILIACGVAVVPPLLLILAWLFFTFRLERVHLRQQDSGLTTSALLIYAAAAWFAISISGHSYISHVITLPDSVFWIVAGTAGAAFYGAFLARSRILKGAAGRPSEMEACPLKDEIVALGARFNIPVESVRVRPLRTRKDGQTLSSIEQAHWAIRALRDLDPVTPVLPMEMLQRMEASAVTSLLATVFARREKGLHWIHPRTAVGRYLLRPFQGWAAAVTIGFPLLLGVAEIQPGPAVLLFLIFSAIWTIRLARLSRMKDALMTADRIEKSFRAWADIDPADRSAREFVAGQVTLVYWASNLRDVELVVRSFKGQRGWKEFLDRALPGGFEEGAEITREVWARGRAEEDATRAPA